MDALNELNALPPGFLVRKKDSNSSVRADNGLEGLDGRWYNNNRIESNKRCDIAIKIATTTVRGVGDAPQCPVVQWSPGRCGGHYVGWKETLKMDEFYDADVHMRLSIVSHSSLTATRKDFIERVRLHLCPASNRRERGTHNDAGDGINRWIYNRQYIRY